MLIRLKSVHVNHKRVHMIIVSKQAAIKFTICSHHKHFVVHYQNYSAVSNVYTDLQNLDQVKGAAGMSLDQYSSMSLEDRTTIFHLLTQQFLREYCYIHVFYDPGDQYLNTT